MNSLCALILSAFSMFSGIDDKCANFEKENGRCSVLITECSNYKAVYSFNNDWVYRKGFPAGSLMKPFSAAVFLSHKNIFLKTPTIKCTGRFYFSLRGMNGSKENAVKNYNGETYVGCSLKNGHGIIDLSRAVSDSCNVFFLTKASEDPEAFYAMLHEYFLLSKNAADNKLGNSGNSPRITLSREKMILSAIGEDGHLLYSPAKISSMYISLLYDNPVREISTDGSGNIIGNININPVYRNSIKKAMAESLVSGTMKNIRSSSTVKVLYGKTGSPSRIGEPLRTHAWAVVFFKYQGKDYLITAFSEKGYGGKEAVSLISDILNDL
ncbi:MAG: hypothetical protein KAZ87_06885 [Spirochaetes bacterium]|nr:hypothetical protein [Spirochaetota bacterium]